MFYFPIEMINQFVFSPIHRKLIKGSCFFIWRSENTEKLHTKKRNIVNVHTSIFVSLFLPKERKKKSLQTLSMKQKLFSIMLFAFLIDSFLLLNKWETSRAKQKVNILPKKKLTLKLLMFKFNDLLYDFPIIFIFLF